jgi:hypothetical protein
MASEYLDTRPVQCPVCGETALITEHIRRERLGHAISPLTFECPSGCRLDPEQMLEVSLTPGM